MLQLVSRVDHWLSKHMAVCATEKSSYGHLRWLMMALEYTGHEALVFPAVMVLIAAAIPHHVDRLLNNEPEENKLHAQLPVFLAIFLGLFVEVAAVSLMKVVFKRHRPKVNASDMPSAFPGIDLYSFPSGHTSRMTMLCLLAAELYYDFLYDHPYAWPLAALVVFVGCIGVSRVILGRHFPTDIVAGFVLGVVMAQIVLYCLVPFFEFYRVPIATVLFQLKTLVVLVISSVVPTS